MRCCLFMHRTRLLPQMPRATDFISDLIARTAQGDRAAFRALYDATAAKLFGVVIRILQRRDLAEDILQDVYVRIWDRAADFDPERASPITWLASIARNRAIDEVRRAAPVRLDDAPEIETFADPGRLPSEHLEVSDELARLQRCLDGLEPERRDMVSLAYLDGLSREALAQRFGKPVATVKTWLHRSLKQLRECLGP